MKEGGKIKFKILPKVANFTDAQGREHYPGDIVDLSESYKGENWLEPLKIEVLPSVEAKPIPLETKKPKQK
jgi:hypothetical protein